MEVLCHPYGNCIRRVVFLGRFESNVLYRANLASFTFAVVQLASDASNIDWGGWLLHTAWQSSPVNNVARDFFEPWERSQSSSMRELLGVLGSLRAFLPWCQDAVVFCQTDC